MEPRSQKSFGREVLITGLIAGTLDILSALTHAYLANGITPVRVFQYIASALLGMEAFSGGAGVVIMGLVMHYLIAFSWTLLFFVIYPKLRFLSKNRVITGILYGAFVWVMMSRLLVPLTAVPKSPFNLTSALIGMAILMAMIGMPNSFRANRYYSR